MKLSRRGVLSATVLGAIAGVCGLEAPRPAEAAVAGSFVLVVHPSTAVGSISREFASDAFLKKVSRWADGEALRPVDLRPSSTLRQVFSATVLKRSVSAVKNYWQQRIFSGRDVPPPELDTEEAVVRYVGRTIGAIGYVSTSANLTGVKIVTIR